MGSASAALAIVKGLISLANAIAGYFNDAQLLEAGKALERSANLQKAADENRKANAARDAVVVRLRDDPFWVPPHDPNRRD